MNAGCARSNSIHFDRHREVAAAALLALDRDQIGGDRGPARDRKPALGIGGDRQQQVTGIGTHGEQRAGVGAHRDADVAENLAELIELLEVDVGRRARRSPHRDRRAATLGEQRDAQYLDADRGPVIR
jgi:hypothetical protein